MRLIIARACPAGMPAGPERADTDLTPFVFPWNHQTGM
jgi:hypothetical protein